MHGRNVTGILAYMVLGWLLISFYFYFSYIYSFKYFNGCDIVSIVVVHCPESKLDR